jgi:hypothetical protein
VSAVFSEFILTLLHQNLSYLRPKHDSPADSILNES